MELIAKNNSEPYSRLPAYQPGFVILQSVYRCKFSTVQKLIAMCSLVRRPAVLTDIEGVSKKTDSSWTRTFSGKSDEWGGGGVADIVAMRFASHSYTPPPVCGYVAMLTDSQLKSIEQMEQVPGVYAKHRAKCLISGSEEETNAVIFVRTGEKRFCMPSEAYKCAVLRNVRQHHTSSSTLPIIANGKFVEDWEPPGAADLTFSALLFTVGVTLDKPPLMPFAIKEWQHILATKMQVTTTAELIQALQANTDVALLTKLQPVINRNFLIALRRTLGGECCNLE